MRNMHDLPWFIRVIGTIDGSEILGFYNDDYVDPERLGRPMWVEAPWGDDLAVWVDVREAGDIRVGLPFRSSEGLSLAEVGQLRELFSSDFIARLIPIARAHAASPCIVAPPRELPPVVVRPEPRTLPPLQDLPEYPRLMAACEALNAIFAEIDARETAEQPHPAA